MENFNVSSQLSQNPNRSVLSQPEGDLITETDLSHTPNRSVLAQPEGDLIIETDLLQTIHAVVAQPEGDSNPETDVAWQTMLRKVYERPVAMEISVAEFNRRHRAIYGDIGQRAFT